MSKLLNIRIRNASLPRAQQVFENQPLFLNTEFDPGALVSISRSSICLNDMSMSLNSAMRLLGVYAIVYTLSGHCTYLGADQKVRRFGPGDLFFVFPDVPHRYFPSTGQSWRQLWITFHGRVFDAWRAVGALTQERFSLRLLPIDDWSKRIQHVISQIDRTVPRRTLLGQCAFQSLLAEILCGDVRADGTKAQDDWLSQAQSFMIAVERADQLDLRGIADRMHSSYSNFRRKFTELAGVSPAQFHARMLMHRACQLMRTDHITNRELAERLGYSSEFHFSRRFSKVIGSSPKSYRERMFDAGAGMAAGQNRDAAIGSA